MIRMQIFFIFVTALFSSLVMVPFLRRWALERGEVDHPDGRKVHSQAIPRLGGIAIFLAALFAILIHVDPEPEVRGILAGGLVIFLTGLVDDLNRLSPRYKILGQAGGCLIAMVVGKLYITNLGDLLGLGPVTLPFWLAVPFTVFAVVGVINAINLIDGLDGLSGGISVIALASFLILALQEGNQNVMFFCAAGLGAIFGFLKYNFFPARIFMGDTGSLSVGFLLAFLAIALTQRSGNHVQPLIPVLVLGLPILDTVWVMTTRILRKTSPFNADRTHLHHKFLNLGFQHRFTVIIIYGLSVFWAGFSIVFQKVPQYFLLAIYLGVSMSLYLGLRYILINSRRFPFLTLDSAKGIRNSVLYLRMADIVAQGVPGLFALIALYLMTAAWSVHHVGFGPWQANGILGMAGIGLLFLTRDVENQFLLAMTYVAGLLLTFSIETAGSQFHFAGFALDRFTDLLFAPMGALVVLKLLFRREGEFFVSTADILFFCLSILFAAAFSEMGLVSAPSTMVKAIFLYLGIKTLVAESRKMSEFAVGSVLTVLLIVALRDGVA
jgi:UDP-GlcNAc:undecaprenyl-phosphate GlcNAc-1-phosphate transferase